LVRFVTNSDNSHHSKEQNIPPKVSLREISAISFIIVVLPAAG